MHFGLIVVAMWVLLTALWYILPTARADIYDLLLARTTAKWYAAVLARVEPDSRLLDVGIGTATALVRNKELVSSRCTAVRTAERAARARALHAHRVCTACALHV